MVQDKGCVNGAVHSRVRHLVFVIAVPASFLEMPLLEHSPERALIGPPP